MYPTGYQVSPMRQVVPYAHGRKSKRRETPLGGGYLLRLDEFNI